MKGVKQNAIISDLHNIWPYILYNIYVQIQFKMDNELSIIYVYDWYICLLGNTFGGYVVCMYVYVGIGLGIQ